VTLHRRPLGRGRTLAALSAPLLIVGCLLPWWQVGGTPGIPVESGNGLAGPAIGVFLVGAASAALAALPYAMGDRPAPLDRWISFAILAGFGWIGFGWRVVELAQAGAFQFNEPAAVLTNGPGIWLAVVGLIVLSRAVFEVAEEPPRL
jgi:hypothetical protein